MRWKNKPQLEQRRPFLRLFETLHREQISFVSTEFVLSNKDLHSSDVKTDEVTATSVESAPSRNLIGLLTVVLRCPEIVNGKTSWQGEPVRLDNSILLVSR